MIAKEVIEKYPSRGSATYIKETISEMNILISLEVGSYLHDGNSKDSVYPLFYNAVLTAISLKEEGRLDLSLFNIIFDEDNGLISLWMDKMWRKSKPTKEEVWERIQEKKWSKIAEEIKRETDGSKRK